MKWFRRFIARLFNIQPEDLPQARRKPPQLPLSAEIKREIGREIERQIPMFFQGDYFSKIERIIEKKISQEVATAISHMQIISAGDQDSISHETLIEERGTSSDTEELPIIEEHQDISSVGEPAVDQIEPISPLGAGLVSGTEEAITEGVDRKLFEQFVPEDEEILPLEETPVVEPLIGEIPGLIPAKERAIRLGIDFGTTTTAISVRIEDEIPEALIIGRDGITRYIPSVVYFLAGNGSLDERVLVGEDAEAFGEQALVIRSIKRCLGCNGTRCTKTESGDRRFAWCHGDGMIRITETEFLRPEKIVYYIVREAVSRATRLVRERWHIDLTHENVTVLPLNMGCSANFDLRQRTIIQSIAQDLGFENVQIDNVVEEPILAGFTFSRFAENPMGRALIYDFGGGTFDVAVIEVDRTDSGLRVTVLTTGGESWLGGDDIDNLLYLHFLEHIAKEVEVSPNQAEEEMEIIERSQLRTIARQAKEQLSTTENYKGALLSRKWGTINLEIERNKFEDLLRNSRLVDESLEAVRRACQLAYAYENLKEGRSLDAQAVVQYKLQDAIKLIDKVILVGGVTKIPYVRKVVEQIFPDKIVDETVIEPISAVAIGGAYPREPQHYSLTVPPYGFYLEAERTDLAKGQRWIVFEPFEFYRFHDYWGTNNRPAHVKRIKFPFDLRRAALFYARAGAGKPTKHDDIGGIKSGEWKFAVTIEGEMFLQEVGGDVQSLKPYPIIHPVQQAILEAREERERAETEGLQGTREEDWISIFTEN